MNKNFWKQILIAFVIWEIAFVSLMLLLISLDKKYLSNASPSNTTPHIPQNLVVQEADNAKQ